MKKAKFGFIEQHERLYSVATMCRALGVSRQGYYAWKKRGLSKHDIRDAELTSIIAEEYEISRGHYGSPKIFMRLRQKGIHTSRKRIARIMVENDFRGTTRSNAKRASCEKRVSKKASAPDHIKRNFSATGPNEAWFADITYVRTHRGWLYLAIVMDIWSRKIVGWSMDKTMTAELADNALRMAIGRRHPKPGCFHHSDHGSQYVSLLLSKTMRDNDIVPSMGSISSPWDNAVTESLMGIIKSECVHARTFATREQATMEIFEYIECYYNRIRIHSALGYLSPEDFENKELANRSEAA